jgi:hypothetical protein
MRLGHIETAICVASATGLFSERTRQHQLLPAAAARQVPAAHKNADVHERVGSIACRVFQSTKANMD